MKKLFVTPHSGIGTLKLGMSPDQIIKAIKHILFELNLPDNREINISREKEEDGFTERYLYASLFFMVRYRDNQAVEISIDREMDKHATVLLYDIDVFQTPVEQLINTLKQFSLFTYDLEDEQLSTDYVFYDIGIRLWREEPFHIKLLKDKEYLKQMELVLDEMYRYLFFEIITVKQQGV